MWKWWPEWTEFPWWQLAVVAGIYVWLIRVGLKIFDNLVTDPLAVKLASSLRRLARALVTARRHHVLKAETGRFRVITGTAHIQLGPATLSGTVTQPWDQGHRLIYGRSNPSPLTPDGS